MSFYIKDKLSLKEYELGGVSFHLKGISLFSSPKPNEIHKILSSEIRRKTSLVKFVVDEDIELLNEIIKEVHSYLIDHEISVGIYLDSLLISKIDPNFVKDKGVFISHSLNDEASFENDYYCGNVYGLCTANLRTKGASNKRSKDSIYIDISFNQKLIQYLNKSNKSNVEVYRNGGITRKVFSKILSKDTYIPKKETILCLIIGMELCLDDALDLLNAAGFTLSNSLITDIIIKQHIQNKTFDIEVINSELDENGQIPLGWKPREE